MTNIVPIDMRRVANIVRGMAPTQAERIVAETAALLCERESLIQELLRCVDCLPSAHASLHRIVQRVREFCG